MPEYVPPPVVIVEVPTGPRPIEPVGTSTCALVGQASAGEAARALEVATTSEAERAHGDGWLLSAATDFFTQGGRQAVLVRATGPEALAALEGTRVQLLVVDPMVVDPATAYSWCEERRVFLVVDARPDGTLPPGLGHNAAAYHPGLLDRAGTRSVAPAVAGVMARNDATRGVWTSPAGRDAEVLGGRPSIALDSAASEALTLASVNPLRDIGDGRLLVWGARTAGSDPEWKYVAVRRLFLFLEESIDEGLQWVVFEPNGEPLWAQVRALVEDFLLEVWRQGALRGQAPDEAFFVRCDSSTMTQDDLDNGRLVVVVGIAPVRPAEFVILRIGHWTADRPDPDPDPDDD